MHFSPCCLFDLRAEQSLREPCPTPPCSLPSVRSGPPPCHPTGSQVLSVTRCDTVTSDTGHTPQTPTEPRFPVKETPGGVSQFSNEGPEENGLYPIPQWPSPWKPPALPVLGSPVLPAPGHACWARTGRSHPAQSHRLPASRCWLTRPGRAWWLGKESHSSMHKPQKPAATGLPGGTHALTLP